MRNILSMVMTGWRLEVKALRVRRQEASLHLVKAWRLRPKGHWWLDERAYLFFQLWRRMVAHNKVRRPASQDASHADKESHLIEWDEWVEQDQKQRLFISKLQKQCN